MEQSRYRPDIDGVRALAIMPILLFHAGVPYVRGGYIGVDIFFVISGFLITRILYREIIGGTFSYLTFYQRRIRRILPALAVVVMATLCLGWIVLLPHQYEVLAGSAGASVLFVANIWFWLSTDYFAPPASTLPLLHLWSLAVEEHFYIFFPLTLVLLVRYCRSPGRLKIFLWTIAVASFALSAWGIFEFPVATFYLLPTRAWELLVGALLALEAIPQARSRLAREFLPILGFCLVLFGMFFLTKSDPFPGLNALIPVVGSMLLIQYGDRSAFGARFLSARPMVAIGLISYSLYLWHWPILVLGAQTSLEPLALDARLGLVGLAVLAAVASYILIETPFRRKSLASTSTPLFVWAGGASALLLAFAGFVMLQSGVPQRLASEVTRLAAFAADRNPRNCHDFNGTTPFNQSCVRGASVEPAFAIWGDSHSNELSTGVGQVAREAGQSVRQLSSSACPPALGATIARRSNCVARNAHILENLIKAENIETVFLVARFSNYKSKDLYKGIERSVVALREGGKKVVLVFPIPNIRFDAPDHLSRAAMKGIDPSLVTSPRKVYLARQRIALRELAKIQKKYKLPTVRPERKLCPDDACLAYGDGSVLYLDDNHLSLSGARYVAELFRPFFRNNPKLVQSSTSD